jgi:flagellar biosynthesis component FlhA
MKKSELRRLIREEIIQLDSPVNSLYIKFIESINTVDENLSYKDLAKVISKILKEEYGVHNFKPFLEELIKELK